ncbi:heavy metal translocating P-type ATPase [Croceivirga thetidis]|uniref:HAD-IC family P-type ATPase n=1 Tax=Croceivirga thetidis TaxID=2721623 RepID=A0ABX1GNW8_9FLAO|nr:heavy metal translocating P-type ATPase metal-binding domain-containing protein [Croceivirga thetidis]NKI31264.1 HAD-IC family P-type ATPase [Croceivirga thetidis]
MSSSTCYHCGDVCDNNEVLFDSKRFCCNGCKSVYQILIDGGLDSFYEMESNPGISPHETSGKFDFLENQEVVQKLLDFDEGGVQVIQLHIPNMHCSSCIWVLENLGKLHIAIKSSQVDFPKKQARFTYDKENLSLKELALLLSTIGYEPVITLEDYSKTSKTTNNSLIYKLGVAGFAFGNVMLLSFPEYFEVEEFWLDRYKLFFRWLMFAFSLPVVFYAAQDYFKSAFKGLKSSVLNIDVPIALGILTLFVRSTVDIVFDLGSGFFDSLTGLVFFLLVGRFFQQKTYAHLSFERDYKSYFPIAITRIVDENEETIEIHKINRGDRILVRNQEIIPVDAILLKGYAQVDYSFVTGESEPLKRKLGDKLFAGGRQIGGVLELEVLKSVSQSYLTQLWSNKAFSKNKASSFQTLTDALSKRFTLAVLTIAFLATGFWLWHDPSKALNVFTAVLIIACPCAIALAAPFTLGNVLRIFGRFKFYVKDTNTLERLARIQTIVFDKTGTLTSNNGSAITYEGMQLTEEEKVLLKTTLRGSNHPLSRELYGILKSNQIETLDEFVERTGKGLEGKLGEHSVKIGSAAYVGNSDYNSLETTVHVAADENYKGRFVFKSQFRNGIVNLLQNLRQNYSVAILSGDNKGEKNKLAQLLPFQLPMLFEQKPEDKLEFIESLQRKAKVLMVGDGLNDAGALAQSDVGVAVAENVNVFSPASDAILEASKLNQLASFLAIARQSIKVIKACFLLSLGYNLIGLYFAVTGQLQPVIAAILMPLSSISIVVLATLTTNILGRKLATKT